MPPLVDEYGSELQDVIIQHWGSRPIRTHASHGPVQSRYNIRLMTSDIGGLELGHIFARACVRACVRAYVRACGRTVCVQLTFQNGSHKKHGTEMQRLFCNIVRNTNLVHIISTYTEHYHYAQTK